MIKVGEDIQIERTEFNGNEYISIRRWFSNKEGELRPTKKGINLKLEEWKDFINKFNEIKKL